MHWWAWPRRQIVLIIFCLSLQESGVGSPVAGKAARRAKRISSALEYITPSLHSSELPGQPSHLLVVLMP